MESVRSWILLVVSRQWPAASLIQLRRRRGRNTDGRKAATTANPECDLGPADEDTATTTSEVDESNESAQMSTSDTEDSDDAASSNCESDAAPATEFCLDSSDSSSEAVIAPRTRSTTCVNCDQGVEETAYHLWWECAAYDVIRQEDTFTALMAKDRSDWPDCLVRYGIATTTHFSDITAIQTLMVRILRHRRALESVRRAQAVRTHAWTDLAGHTATRHAFDFSRIPDNPPRWKFGAPAMRALKSWLAHMQWTEHGEISNIELAVDFELFSGTLLHDEEEPANILERGQALWTMLAQLCTVCKNLQLPRPFPAERVERVNCLNSIGARGVWGGVTPRPQFTKGQSTAKVLESCVAAAIAVGWRNWGADIFPVYNPAEVGDASRWVTEPAPPLRSSTPVRVGDDVTLLRAPTRVCNAHAKPKCSMCLLMKRNYSLTIEQCCAVHHRDGDDLEVQACEEHRMTRCGVCSSALVCCSKGHHGHVNSDDDADNDMDGDAPVDQDGDGKNSNVAAGTRTDVDAASVVRSDDDEDVDECHGAIIAPVQGNLLESNDDPMSSQPPPPCVSVPTPSFASHALPPPSGKRTLSVFQESLSDDILSSRKHIRCLSLPAHHCASGGSQPLRSPRSSPASFVSLSSTLEELPRTARRRGTGEFLAGFPDEGLLKPARSKRRRYLVTQGIREANTRNSCVP